MLSEFLHHYTEILSDPAHLAVELTLMLLVDGLVLGLLWPVAKRRLNHRIHREHQVLDAEHGVDHAAVAGGVPMTAGLVRFTDAELGALHDMVQAEMASRTADPPTLDQV